MSCPEIGLHKYVNLFQDKTLAFLSKNVYSTFFIKKKNN